MVQRTLQESSDGSKIDEMNECLSDATQEVPRVTYRSIAWILSMLAVSPHR